MNVLLTNDDGIGFKGIGMLAEVFSEVFDVYVVAPEGERSSQSHHLTIKGRIRYEERKMPFVKKAYALWGTPADCVHMALHALPLEKIDLVVSGINKGANISTDIIYSGTISAAREAFIYHVPAMALSLDRNGNDNYEAAARIGLKIALAYLEEKDREDYFLNIPHDKKVIETFSTLMELRKEVNGDEGRKEQDSYMFTNSSGAKRIRIGYNMSDNYLDQVEVGIAKVKTYLESLAKDDQSKELIGLVLKLLARDQKGNLKASRVIQLGQLAEKSGNEDFQEGIRIIREAYRPTRSKLYIRCALHNEDTGWNDLALSLSEV